MIYSDLVFVVLITDPKSVSRRKVERIMTELTTYNLFTDGQTVEPDSGDWSESLSPYTGKPWAQIARDGATDVDDRRATAACRSRRGCLLSAFWAR